MNILLLALVLILIIMLTVIFSFGKNKNQELSIGIYVLGTLVQLKAYGKKSNIALQQAEEKLKQIDDKMSVFKNDSEISNINRNAGQGGQTVSSDTYFVIKEAIKYCKLCKGTFDITIRPIVAIWGIGKDKARIPKKSEIEQALKLVNYEDIVLEDDIRWIGLKHKHQQLDVGGIAKGYAADEVKNIFVKNNIKSAMINLGGNIFVLGKKKGGTNWKVGIQNPLGAREEFIGTIELSNKSIVTSGGYERYSVLGGKKFQHIIDPRNGCPSESDVISVTIISDLSIEGDGLSTGLYILGVKEGMKVLKDLKGVEAIFITSNKEVYITDGIRDKLELCNEEFKLNGSEINYEEKDKKDTDI